MNFKYFINNFIKNNYNKIKRYTNIDIINNLYDTNINQFSKIICNIFDKILIEKNDNTNAIIEINAGVGGIESSIFVYDLFKIYSHFCLCHNMKIQIIKIDKHDIGYRNVQFNVLNNYAYCRFLGEYGVHRIQRVPKTEVHGRIHTSTASVSVLPLIKFKKIVLNNKDLKVETFRASGHGGQHVNKTNSAVRITHLPTMITASQQDEKVQALNKQLALQVLTERVNEHMLNIEFKKISDNKKSKLKNIERADKIRTYNIIDSRLTDHRLNLTIQNDYYKDTEWIYFIGGILQINDI